MKNYHKYHKFVEGKKVVKHFPLDIVPDETWTRGAGPFSPEAYDTIFTALRKACVGVPKTPEQKAKMSLAKKGVPKTAEHRANMSIAQRKRYGKE